MRPNFDGLLDLWNLVRANNFHPTSITTGYRFSLCRRDELIRYYAEIGFKVERKQKKLGALLNGNA